jgi:hypothetical protein
VARPAGLDHGALTLRVPSPSGNPNVDPNVDPNAKVVGRRLSWYSADSTIDKRIEQTPEPHLMPTYTCSNCGMSVNMTCGQCGSALVNDVLTKDDGSTVNISKCPEGHGKIKSPMCCAQDMTCAV